MSRIVEGIKGLWKGKEDDNDELPEYRYQYDQRQSSGPDNQVYGYPATATSDARNGNRRPFRQALDDNYVRNGDNSRVSPRGAEYRKPYGVSESSPRGTEYRRPYVGIDVGNDARAGTGDSGRYYSQDSTRYSAQNSARYGTQDSGQYGSQYGSQDSGRYGSQDSGRYGSQDRGRYGSQDSGRGGTRYGALDGTRGDSRVALASPSSRPSLARMPSFASGKVTQYDSMGPRGQDYDAKDYSGGGFRRMPSFSKYRNNEAEYVTSYDQQPEPLSSRREAYSVRRMPSFNRHRNHEAEYVSAGEREYSPRMFYESNAGGAYTTAYDERPVYRPQVSFSKLPVENPNYVKHITY